MPSGVYIRTKPIWNKGLTKEIDERVRKISESKKGKKNTIKHNINISEAQKGNKYTWDGGSYACWHIKAWEKFGKNYCEICYIDINTYMEKYNKRFDMHNTLNPKDHTILEPEVWQCLCINCHKMVEKEEI
jgi:hypothetical protein